MGTVSLSSFVTIRVVNAHCHLNHFCHLLFICLAGSTLNPAQGNPSFAASTNTFATTSQNVTNITPGLWYPAPNLTPAPRRLAFNPTAYANGSGESLLISTGFLFLYYMMVFLSCVYRVRCSAVPNTMMFTPNSPQFPFPEFMSCPVTTPSAFQKQSVDHLATALSKFSIEVGGKMSHRRGKKLRETFQSRHEQHMLNIGRTLEEQGLLYSNHLEEQGLLYSNHLENQDLLYAKHSHNQDLRHTSRIESMRDCLKESAYAIREANDYDFLAALHTESSPESVSDE